MILKPKWLAVNNLVKIWVSLTDLHNISKKPPKVTAFNILEQKSCTEKETKVINAFFNNKQASN